MTNPTRRTPFHYHAALTFLLGCSETPPGDGPDLEGSRTTGDSSGLESPTTGPGSPDETPTTGDGAAETGGTTTELTGSSTGEPAPSCGDGLIDVDEQCDDGAANSDNAFCTVDCLFNVCGDGNLFVGWELCDQGAANSDRYGSACGAQCSPGVFCGDHIIQPEEECDLGVNNGGAKGDEQGILCDASCTSQVLRAFVTSQAFTGDLGALAGADKKCRDAATAAGLPQPYRFHAYLSTPDSPANARFPGENSVPTPYVLVTGKKIADSHAKLLAEGPTGEGISVTESGTSIYGALVATNTSPSGTSFSMDQHCLAWTSAEPLLKARVGVTFPEDPADAKLWLTDGGWVGMLTLTCYKPVLHLYCLEI